MTKQVQRRRGTATQHTSFTGVEGEISVNTTNKSIHVHDGTTAGGIEAARADMTNVTDANLNARLNGNTLSSLTITSADINGGTIDGAVIGGTTAAAITGTTIAATGNITVGGTVDGRDVAADGTKLDGIEAGADVTDTANVTAAGALMDSELTNITAVKALDQGVATTDDPTFTGVDLDAIAASKAVTAVDVFVYDTSKDSDGGAWRKRCQHTSWYNETLNTATRGSRREFPAVAVIVAESSKVTIYDGDDPALPMWAVWTNGMFSPLAQSSSITSVVAGNGELNIGRNYLTNFEGLTRINLIADHVIGLRFSTYTNDQRFAPSSRPLTADYAGGYVSAGLVSALVNDVAMTVLPDAPIDPATGLPVPTIAVATNGGVSVIKDDGTVVDLGAAISTHVTFDDDGNVFVYYDSGNAEAVYGFNVPSSDQTGYTPNIFVFNNQSWSGSYQWPTIQFKESAGVVVKDNYVSMGANEGLYKSLDTAQSDTVSSNFQAKITSTYNTGWMNGDIKGAFLSSTDTASLVGSGELVTNGDFATNDLTGWTDTSVGSGATPSASTGAAVLPRTDGSNYARITQAFSCVIGQSYTIQADVSVATAYVWVGTSLGGSNVSVDQPAAGTHYTKTFVATASTLYVSLLARFDGTSTTVDNISVKLADADRSVNNKGLIVNGTVTRSPVATGAELVAYSGFSSSNYLEQPYNSALDFGTGDFCVMGWVNVPDAVSSFRSFERNDLASPDVTKRIVVNVTGGLVGAYAGSTAITSAVTSGVWNYVTAVRSDGVFYLYVNGVQKASQTNTLDLNLSSAITRLGSGVQYAGADHNLALWRISATAPTAEQIKKIYEDEKVLFQENAATTLYGTSDAVTALAHDEDTGLLHVGTSAGRSVFQGLRRVANTTTAVGTAISASNGLVVEE